MYPLQRCFGMAVGRTAARASLRARLLLPSSSTRHLLHAGRVLASAGGNVQGSAASHIKFHYSTSNSVKGFSSSAAAAAKGDPVAAAAYEAAITRKKWANFGGGGGKLRKPEPSSSGSSSGSSGGASAGGKGKSKSWWRRVFDHRYTRRGIRGARVAVVAGSLFGYGYSAGLMHYAEDPAGTERAMTLTMLNQAVKESKSDGGGGESACRRRLYRIVGEKERLMIPTHHFLFDLGPTKKRGAFRELRAADLRTAGGRAARDAARAATLHSRRVAVDPAARAGATAAENHASRVFAACARVQRVGKRVLDAARARAREEYAAARRRVAALEARKAQAGGPADTTGSAAAVRLELGEARGALEKWRKARLALEGGGAGGWSFVVADNRVPNAFVSAMAPRKMFVFTALLDLATSDDELAMVLGHELAHMMLQHGAETAEHLAWLAGLQLVVLGVLDPTGGLLALLPDAGLWLAARTSRLAHSRDHETGADALGIDLAARACYDPAKAAGFFGKMLKHERRPRGGGGGGGGGGGKEGEGQAAEEGGGAPGGTHAARGNVLSTVFFRTHPPTQERSAALAKLLPAAQAAAAASGCQAKRQAFWAGRW